jgi:hypothetical protein
MSCAALVVGLIREGKDNANTVRCANHPEVIRLMGYDAPACTMKSARPAAPLPPAIICAA